MAASILVAGWFLERALKKPTLMTGIEEAMNEMRQKRKQRRAPFFAGLLNLYAPGENMTQAVRRAGEQIGINDKTLYAVRVGITNLSEEKVDIIKAALAKKREASRDDQIIVNAIDELDPSVCLASEEDDEPVQRRTRARPRPEVQAHEALGSGEATNLTIDGISVEVPEGRRIAVSRRGSTVILEIFA